LLRKTTFCTKEGSSIGEIGGASPLLFGLLMDYMGIGMLAVSAGLSLSALFALLMLRARPTAAPAPA